MKRNTPEDDGEKAYKLISYKNSQNTALFDSRAFVLPKEEVCNYFIWRQQAALRNSMQMTSQSIFTQKELNGLKITELHEKLLKEKNIDWNDFSNTQKIGSCVVKELKWAVDNNIPVFSKDKSYVEKFV